MAIKSKGEFSQQLKDVSKLKIGIVKSKWNTKITSELLHGCIEALEEGGLKKDQVHLLEVPGTYELPYGARLLDSHYQLDGIICIGCVIKGETDHDVFISQSTAQTLSNMSVMANKPVVFGVVTTKTEEQATARAGGAHGHKGIEAAETLLSLLASKEQLEHSKSKIGFYAGH